VSDAFLQFLESCGNPRLIIENVNRRPSKGRPDLQTRVGTSEFLLVKGRLASPTERLRDVPRRRTSQGLSAVKISTDSSSGLTAIITTADVEPLSREDFRGFVRAGRVISPGSYRTMGDEYGVSLEVVKQVHGATSNSWFLLESAAPFSMAGVTDGWSQADVVEHLLFVARPAVNPRLSEPVEVR
jgi:hypothetical protein